MLIDPWDVIGVLQSSASRGKRFMKMAEQFTEYKAQLYYDVWKQRCWKLDMKPKMPWEEKVIEVKNISDIIQ